MLKRLFIKDFAIVEELEVIFNSGFQVITGETGAGKSILVGALGYLCGDRASTDILRSGALKTIMEAEFFIKDTDPVKTILGNLEIECQANVIILRREINDKGVSRAFVNDTPVNLAVLNQVSDHLIDLHGQHQHQRLLKQETHIDYLDAYGQLGPDIEKYRSALKEYRSAQHRLDELQSQQKDVQEKQELYNFQIAELGNANLSENEYESLQNEKKILENSEILFDKSTSVADILINSELSTLNRITGAISELQKIAQVDETFIELLKNLESSRVTVEEIGMECEQYSSRLEFDPERLEEIRNRQAELEYLAKKYRVKTVTDLVRLFDDLKLIIKNLDNFDNEIENLEKKLEMSRERVQGIAVRLSQKRKEHSSTFEYNMNKLLHSVGLPNATFLVKFDLEESEKGEVRIANKKYIINEQGMDIIEFQVGINIGEPEKPLQKVASGGEVSRIMLCIKSLLAKTDAIDTLVFDEIDNGISGKYAQIVGKKIHHMADEHQLIVITHLPQIAAQARDHYSVRKFESGNRTHVDVIKLDPEQRVKDVAKLLAGENITENTMANARELINNVKEIHHMQVD